MLGYNDGENYSVLVLFCRCDIDYQIFLQQRIEFRVCHHDEPRSSFHTAREGEHIYRGEKELGRAIVNKESMDFH